MGIDPSEHDDNTPTEPNDLTVEETSGKCKHNFEESTAKRPEMSERNDAIQIINEKMLGDNGNSLVPYLPPR